MYIKLGEILNSLLTDDVTKSSNSVKLTTYLIDALRIFTDTGFDGKFKTVAIEVGDDLMYRLPDDFAGINRIGYADSGCFYSLSVDNSLLGDYCKCGTPSGGGQQNYCTSCGGFYDWGSGVWFNGAGYWAGGLWYAGLPRLFGGISTRSPIGTYKIERLASAEDFIRFSSNLRGMCILMEYQTSYSVMETSIPEYYKLPLIEYARWQHFSSKGNANMADYYKAQYGLQWEIARAKKTQGSYTLDDLVRAKYGAMAGVKF